MDNYNTATGTARTVQPAQHSTVHRHFLDAALPFLAVIIGTLVVIAPVWRDGYPWGSDVWGHLQRAESLGNAIRQHGLASGIGHSAWMPDWYLGDPVYVYYPPLITLALGGLTALVGSVIFAYRLFVTFLFLALSLSIYSIGMRWRGNALAAALGAILAVAAPYTVHTVFVEGNLGRGLALVIFPWIIWYTGRLLRDGVIYHLVAVLVLLWALLITAHVMQAMIFALVITCYMLLRVLNNVFIPVRRAVLGLLPMALGAGIAAIYLFPAYSYLELKNVPYLPPEKVTEFVATLDALRPYQGNIEAISIGIATLILAAAVMARSVQDDSTALFVTGVLCVIVSFGPDSGIYRLLPLNQSFLPERFLNAAAILFPLIIATASTERWRKRWFVLGCVIAFAVDGVPALRAIFMRPLPPDEQAIAQSLAAQPLPGRVAPLVFPDTTSSLIYLTGTEGRHSNISGWSLENTPNQAVIRRLLSAVDKSPAYVNRILSLWNADYVVGRFQDNDQAARLNIQLNFVPVTQADTLSLWARPTPSSFVQQLPNNRMLVIGDNPTDWLYAFPYATEGTNPNPASYSADYLAHFSVIGLNRIPPDTDIEATLGDWVRKGNTLVVDMSGADQIYTEGFTLFGVQVLPRQFIGAYPMLWTPAPLSPMPAQLTFPNTDGAWIGATYAGLNTDLGLIRDRDQTYTVLGYRDVGGGRVWFVGLNLFYLFSQTGDRTSADILANYIASTTPVNRDLHLPPFNVTWTARETTRLSFRYTSETPVSVIFSMTYFPRWLATLDNAPLPVENSEHLIMLNLPAGAHSITLRYDNLSSASVIIGWILYGLSVVITLVIVLVLRRYPMLSLADRTAAFNNYMP